MDTENPRLFARPWGDRLAARIPFDRLAAEAAINCAYRSSSLREPRHILWAIGPREAARTIAFVENPPRERLRAALNGAVIGAAFWVVIALTITDNALANRSVLAAAILSAILAGFSVLPAGLYGIPMPLGMTAERPRSRVVLLGLGCFLALWSFAFVLQRPGDLVADRFLDGVGLALAALLGMLPGLLLRLRLHAAYTGLPQFLRNLRPSTSVTRDIERARGDAWARYHSLMAGPRPDQTLSEAYSTAHSLTTSFPASRSLELGGTALGDSPVWHDRFASSAPRAARDFQGNGHSPVPPHVDGIALAWRAARIDREGASEGASAFVDLAFRVDRLYPYATVALAVWPPTTVALDPEGRPHAEDGPALAWADGTQVFAWHGQLVPPALVKEGAPAVRSRIERERDPLHRSILIERYGLGRYLTEAGAAEIHSDDCGRLYRLRQSGDEAIAAVRVVNHSPEPDGSFREFWLRVPPTVTTAREAVAWTFGLAETDYTPFAQS